MVIAGNLIASPHPAKPWVDITYPQDIKKEWWDEDWWRDGIIEPAQNHPVKMEEISYIDNGIEVIGYIFKPIKSGKYPPVLFQHGRRGLDDWTLPQIRRLAARGFVVLAPDMFDTYMIEPFPIEHNYTFESHAAAGIDFLLKQDGIIGNKVCTVSHTRGGYTTLKALTKYRKQKDQVGCYVSYYPHWQDPNLPEPAQVYQYAPEVSDLSVPVLVFVGEYEQYQRMRPIISGVADLEKQGRDVTLIVYPGVGRGFDFRPEHVRTFADDLASKDAIQRTAKFIRQHLLQ